jgi:hypothetical protein
MSFVLHVRGVTNLHGGGFVTGAGAVALLAGPGTGKSTLTAHIAASGYPFLTDDIFVIQNRENEYAVPPGFPYLSLAADSIRSVLGESKVPDYITGSAEGEKTRIFVDGEWATFERQPVPLAALVVVARGGSCYRLRRMAPAAATKPLVENSVALPLLPKQLVSRHLTAVSEIALKVPVWRLEIPDGLEHGAEAIGHLKEVFE